MTKKAVLNRLNSLTLDNIRYYMAAPTARYERCDRWVNRFIIAVAEDQINVENFDNFALIVAEFNRVEG